MNARSTGGFEAYLAAIARSNRIEHGLMLPILLYCVDPAGKPMLGPSREGPETEAFLRSAYHDIPRVIPEIQAFWMPRRVAETKARRWRTVRHSHRLRAPAQKSAEFHMQLGTLD